MSVSRETYLSVVSRETQCRLETYASLVFAWNRTINLVSKTTEAEFWHRHIEDCLQLIPLLPPAVDELTDLGSGSGVPGLVLAIAANIKVHLVESDLRKAAFLREATRATGAQVVVHSCRVEDLRLDQQPLVTARALAPLPKLLEWTAPLLAPHGVCLFPKGAKAALELRAAKSRWTMRIEQFKSRTDHNGVVLRLSEIVRV